MHFNTHLLSTFLTAEMNMPNMDIGQVSTGVVNISDAISKYGIAIVIMAVFFIIFMILIVIMLYSNTRMINQIISSKAASDQQDQTLISKLVDNALDAKGVSSKDEIVDTLSNELKESLSPITKKLESLSQAKDNLPENKDDYHKDLVGAYIDINMAFKDISRETLNALNCDRIAIYVFHNGNKSMHGLPFFKMSCIHEWTLHGSTTLRGKSHTDMPLHLFNDFIENLYRYGIYRTDDVNKGLQNDPSIKEFVSFSDTKSLYLVAIKDNEGSLAGFVSAEFGEVNNFETDELKNKQIKIILDNMVSHIAPIIGNKYIFKRTIN